MSSEQEVIRKLEIAAQFVFETGNYNDPRVVEVTAMFDGPQCITQCEFILGNVKNPYCQVFAVNMLQNHLNNHYTSTELQTRLNLKEFLINFLWYDGEGLPPFVLNIICTVIGRIIKLGWFDKMQGEFVFRSAPEQLTKFLQGTTQKVLIGIKAMTSLVDQVDEQGAIRSFTLQRKICTSFRDNALLTLFETSLKILKDSLSKANPVFVNDEVVKSSVSLCLKCLTFDFIGTCPEDSGEDSYSVEIPSSWRGVVNVSVLQLLFDVYNEFHSKNPQVLECVVQLASIRRTFFSKLDRKVYFELLLEMISIILNTGLGLEKNFHQFCRLLVRLKLHDLSTLWDSEGYPKLIESLANFTCASLKLTHIPENDVDYLLILWQKLIGSNNSHCKALNSIDKNAPKIAKAYIEAKLNKVELACEITIDDLLDNPEQLMDQLERFAIIARCQYEDIWPGLTRSFSTVVQNYLNYGGTDSVTQRHLAWLVYVVAAIIGARAGTVSVPNIDAMDGEMSCKVLNLMSMTDGQASSSCEPLELAYLMFFTNFSKTYIGTHVLRSSKIFSLLAEHVRLPNQSTVLDVFVQKILNNFKVWCNSATVMKENLKTLNELSLGYSYVRMLIKLESIQFLLRNHASSDLVFLSMPQYLKLRTQYYTSLARLINTCVEAGLNNALENFMGPFDRSFQNIASAFSNSNHTDVALNSDLKFQVIAMARSLKGLTAAAHNKEVYMLLFEYIFPNYTNVLQEALIIWCKDQAVTTPILKFFDEFVDNKKKRVEFDISCADGILLFRQISGVLSSFISSLLAENLDGNSTQEEQKQRRYFGVKHALNILMHSLSGKYINFGVFKLYNDPALDKALDVFYQVIQRVPLSWLLSYGKMARAYFGLVEVIMEDHMTYFSGLDNNAFQYVMNSINDGLAATGGNSPDDDIAVKCCRALDIIITFHIKAVRKSGNNQSILSFGLDSCGNLFSQMMKTMFQNVMFDECKIYWSLSRPMLALILVNPQVYEEVKNHIINTQSTERQPLFIKHFEVLMQDVDDTLSQRNRNQFTKNINTFRRDITNFTKTAPPEAENGESQKDINEMESMMKEVSM